MSITSITSNGSSSTVIVNGKTYTVSGNNISVKNGNVYVDGKLISENKGSEVVKIEWKGPLASLKSDVSVSVDGDIHGNVDAGGSVNCKDVGKDVNAGGSITCANVNGNVDAGGSVTCANVSGSIDAGGSVITRKL